MAWYNISESEETKINLHTNQYVFFITGNICSCAVDKSTRGHPGRCDARVVCVDIEGVMYPYGQLCASGQCRNSITGVCTTNCSDIICKEEVPSGRCTYGVRGL
jgi:hypothetical protein